MHFIRLVLRVVLFGLLVANAFIFGEVGTSSEALDAAAWLALLTLFLWETSAYGSAAAPWLKQIAHVLRLIAIAGVGFAVVGYLFGGEWLDAGNEGLWFLLIAVLEVEVRNPALIDRRKVLFVTATVLIYVALLAVVGAQLWIEDYLNAYDSVLWLAAFAIIELDVLARPRESADVANRQEFKRRPARQ